MEQENKLTGQMRDMAELSVGEPRMDEGEKKHRAGIFGKMIIPTIIYAVIYTLCLYDNFSGVLVGVFAAATVAYCIYILKSFGRTLKRGSLFYIAVMVLLGFSNGLTGDGVIIFFNSIALFALVVIFLLHNYYQDEKWGLPQYLYAIPAAVFGSVPCFSDFLLEASAYAKDESNEKRRTVFGVLIGMCVALPLLIVTIALLYSADIVFASMIRDTFHIDGVTVFGVVLTFIFAFFSAYCGTRVMQQGKITVKTGANRGFEPVVAITALSLISVVYLVFSVIQIVYLFVGNMSLPDGYTYAEYAREGFFELLAVCVLNVVIVLFTIERFRRHRAIDVLLVLISACTYIMIASSALRMSMYIGVYHLSRLRVMVLWGLALIAVLLVGIVIAVLRQGFPLFRYGVIVVSIGYLVLSYSHMDYFIASYNLKAEHTLYTETEYDSDDTGNIIMVPDDDSENYSYRNYYDSSYLISLSTDAAPAYAKLVPDDAEWLDRYLDRVSDNTGLMDESIRQYNLSHAYVKRTFGERL